MENNITSFDEMLAAKVPSIVLQELFPKYSRQYEEMLFYKIPFPPYKTVCCSENAAYLCYLIAAQSAEVKVSAKRRLKEGIGCLDLTNSTVAEIALLCGDYEVFELTKEKSLDYHWEKYSRVLLEKHWWSGNEFVFYAFLTDNNVERLEYFFKNIELHPQTLIVFYEMACTHGMLACLKLMEKIDGFDKKEAIENAYLSACRAGSLEIVKHLQESEGFDLKAAIKRHPFTVWEFEAFTAACSSGNLELVKYIEATQAFDIKRAIAADEFHAFRVAFNRTDNLDLVKHLEKSAGIDKKILYKARFYEALRCAFQNKPYTAAKYLLKQIDCLRFTVRMKGSYAVILNEFINEEAAQSISQNDPEYDVLLLSLLIQRAIRNQYTSNNDRIRDNNKIILLLKLPVIYKCALNILPNDDDFRISGAKLAQFSREFIKFDRDTATKLLKMAFAMPDSSEINVPLTIEENMEYNSSPHTFFRPPKERQKRTDKPDQHKCIIS